MTVQLGNSSIYVCKYACMYVCMYICKYVCMYVCMAHICSRRGQGSLVNIGRGIVIYTFR